MEARAEHTAAGPAVDGRDHDFSRAVAVDYDGTIAERDIPHPEALSALADLWAMGSDWDTADESQFVRSALGLRPRWAYNNS